MIDGGEAAVNVGAVKFQRAGGFHNLGEGDFGGEIFDALGHFDADLAFVAGDVADGFGDGFDFVGDDAFSAAAFQIKFKFDGSEFWREDFGDEAGDDFEPGATGFARENGKQGVALIGVGFFVNVGLERAVAQVKGAGPVEGDGPGEAGEWDFFEVALGDAESDEPFAEVFGGWGPEIAGTAGRRNCRF